MPDNKKKTHPHDAKRIDIKDPYERRNWTKSLNITEEELKKAVEKAGTSAEKVREFLKKK